MQTEKVNNYQIEKLKYHNYMIRNIFEINSECEINRTKLIKEFIEIYQNKKIIIRDINFDTNIMYSLFKIALDNPQKLTEQNLITIYLFNKNYKAKLKEFSEIYQISDIIFEKDLDNYFNIRYNHTLKIRLKNKNYKSYSLKKAIEMNYTNLLIINEIKKKIDCTDLSNLEIVQLWGNASVK